MWFCVLSCTCRTGFIMVFGRSYLYKGRSRIAVSRIDELATGFGNFTNLMRLVCTSRRETSVPAPRNVSGSWVSVVRFETF